MGASSSSATLCVCASPVQPMQLAVNASTAARVGAERDAHRARLDALAAARDAAAPRADAVAAPKDEADDAPVGGAAPDEIDALARAVDCDLGLLELELKAGALRARIARERMLEKLEAAAARRAELDAMIGPLAASLEGAEEDAGPLQLGMPEEKQAIDL